MALLRFARIARQSAFRSTPPFVPSLSKHGHQVPRSDTSFDKLRTNGSTTAQVDVNHTLAARQSFLPAYSDVALRWM